MGSGVDLTPALDPRRPVRFLRDTRGRLGDRSIVLDLIPLGPFDPNRRTHFVGVAIRATGPLLFEGETLEELIRSAGPEPIALPPWLAPEAKTLGLAVREPTPEHITAAGFTLLAQQPLSGIGTAGMFGLAVYTATLEYLREEPWTWVHGDDPLTLTLRGARHRVSVLGMGGEMYGLVIYRGGRVNPHDAFGLYLEDVPALGVRMMKSLGVRGVPILYGTDARGDRALSPSELETLVAALRGAVELKRRQSLTATVRVMGIHGELEVHVDASGDQPRPAAAPNRDAKVGRNDPCPCGSGKKYKKCCLEGEGARPTPSEAPKKAPAQPTQHAPAPEHELLQRMVVQVFEATDARWPGIVGAARAHCPLGDDPLAMHSLGDNWIAVHAPTPDGRTPLVAYLDQHRERLSLEQRRWAEANARAHLSLHEVVEVTAPFVVVRDLLIKTESRVRDVAVSQHTRPGNGLLARVVQVDGKALLVGVHPQPLAPLDLEKLRGRAERRLSKAGIPRTPEGLRSEAAGRVLMELTTEVIGAQAEEPSRLEDGSTPEEVEDVFDVGDLAKLRAGLDATPQLIADPSEWTLVGPFLEESVLREGRANLSLRGARLHVKTWSRVRADEARSFVEALVGPGQLTHRSRRSEAFTLPRALAGVEFQALVADGIVDPDGIEREKDRLWLARPSLALGGKSPREAARDGRSRRKLEALLKERAIFPRQPGGLDLRAHLGVGEGGRKLSSAERAPALPKLGQVLLDWIAATDQDGLRDERAAFERLARAMPTLWNATREGVSEAARAQLLSQLPPEDRLDPAAETRLVRRRLRLFIDDPRVLERVEVMWGPAGPGLKVSYRQGS